jgi:tRNA(Ile)-lysidine synthase
MPHRSELYARWGRAMKREGYFHPGERVGAAVSGGPDSVLLLEFLERWGREHGLPVAVVHFNHHLRGAESDGDEQFVRELAASRRLEFLRGEADVAQAARASRRNLEATARELRYRFFFSLLRRGRLHKLATGHTANDQAETVLLRLLRGSGTRGLGGIYPVLEGGIVRPFLELTRAEIEAELARRELRWREDSTNRDTRFQRNRLRLELLPRLEKEYNPEIARLLSDLAGRARDDEEVLEQAARERALPWRLREGQREKIPLRPLAEFPPAVARRVLRQMILSAGGSLRGVTHRHIEALRRFALEAQSGHQMTLVGGLAAGKEFDWVFVEPAREASQAGYCFPVKVPGEVAVPVLGAVFRLKIVGAEPPGKTYNEAWRGGLDPQKLTGEICLRNWREGDVFCPLGSRRARKLKEFFARQRIPAGERRNWPLLVNGEEVVWVRGFPPAGRVAAQADTPQVLVVEESAEPGR